MADIGRYKVPTGLRPLLEALAREVLRAQPDDLVAFSQLFFAELQHQRKSNPGIDIISDAASYEIFKADLHEKYRQGLQNGTCSRPGSPQDIAATKIQAAFRGHQVRIHPERYGLPDSRSRSTENLLDNKKDLKRHSIGGYTMDFVTPEDRAATKIQAEIRGFLARRKVSAMRKENADAATKIQAHIRGYLTRKHLEEQGLLSPSRSRSSLHSSKSDDLDRSPDTAATIIQAQVKGYLARKELQQQREAATRIQQAYRDYRERSAE